MAKTKILLIDQGYLAEESKDGYGRSTTDAVNYAKELCAEGCDGLLLVDLSDARDDAAHDVQIACIRRIRENCGVFLCATGNIERMEDIKKLLYAGCDAVALLPETISSGKSKTVAEMDTLREEAAKRFGEEKIWDAEDVNDAASQLMRVLKERRLTPSIPFSSLKTNEQGLVPVVVIDDADDTLLMVAYMNEEAYDKTFATGRMHYYSRERQRLWMKGEESGHFQYVKSVMADCDLDTLQARVTQIGAACHTGERSCFFQEVASLPREKKTPNDVLHQVYRVIEERKAHPKEGSYTNYLFDKGLDKILKKVGEETTEIVIAAKNEGSDELCYEIADAMYHLSVLMCERGVTWEDVFDELARR